MGLLKKKADAPTNPATPPGWAIPDAGQGEDAAAEFEAIHAQEMADSAAWADRNNRAPDLDLVNPAQAGDGAGGFEYPGVTARVFASEDATSLKGARVLLKDEVTKERHLGRVVNADNDESFMVQWDGASAPEEEPKGAYELVWTSPEVADSWE